MNKVHITVCLGTTCHLMGSSHLQTLDSDLPAEIRNMVVLQYRRCLELCSGKDPDKAPFVIINGEVMTNATVHRIIDKINEIRDAAAQDGVKEI